MKLNPNQELIHHPNILPSLKFHFHPRNQSLFSKENHELHTRKTSSLFRKSYPNSSSSFPSLLPFLFQSNSVLTFPSLLFFSLLYFNSTHTQTHTHIYTPIRPHPIERAGERFSACNLQSCYPGWIFTSARRHAGRIGRGAEEKTRSSVLTSIF